MTVTVGETTMWVTGVSKPADDAAVVFYAPYWWVDPTGNEEKANMKFVKVVGADGVSFPALQNFKPLKVHERLYFFKPKDLKKALQNATVIGEDDGNDNDDTGQTGKDKGKKGAGGKGKKGKGGKSKRGDPANSGDGKSNKRARTA